MTWLEKFREDHPTLTDEEIPTLTDEEIMDEFCPDDGLVSNCPLFDGEVDCKKCWMRPADADDDITVAGPIHDPDAGLTVEGPDRT